jgi:hypothetical protein
MGFTNYPNGLTSFGIPQLGDGIPSTFGEYIFVDPDATGADNGKNRKDAFRTVGQAVTKAQTNTHAVIMMAGNSAHSTATDNDELTLTKSRIHFVGLGGGSRYLGQRTRWTMGVTTGTAIAIVQNTGVGNTFTNIKFDSADTLSTSKYAFADGGEYTQMTNCEIVHSGQLGVATAAPLLCNGDSSYYLGCAIGSLVHVWSVAAQNVLFDRETISGKVARDVIFEDCFSLAKTSSATFVHHRGTGATDIERMLVYKGECGFINAKLGAANPAQAVGFTSEQTEGEIVIGPNCYERGNTSVSTTTGVFIYNSGAPSNTGNSGIQSA